jgi:hypothetical protein
MSSDRIRTIAEDLPVFDESFAGSGSVAARIGGGSVGGKAAGLLSVKEELLSQFKHWSKEGIDVAIPRFVVIGTEYFNRFLETNRLANIARSGMSDDYIAHSFRKGRLPQELTDSLRLLLKLFDKPLAIRSSSRLEDALYEPLAGVYVTKMIPNNNQDENVRLQRLADAVKLVYASTYFKAARDYRAGAGFNHEPEEMAVMIQELVGFRHDNRFYPDIAGVARSYNFYPTGSAKPADGIVSLALGLGKTIVDGGIVWSYSPALPRANPPVGSARELLNMTQTEFWAVNVGKTPVSTNGMIENEYLLKCSLTDAEADGTLFRACSTYRADDDKIVMGMGGAGARVITFAPILVAGVIPLNNLLKELLKSCEEKLGNKVEIEFAVAVNQDREQSIQLGFLQVRPMVVSSAVIDIDESEMKSGDAVAVSGRAIGNGVTDCIKDIVYVDPDTFDPADTQQIAGELAETNRRIVESGRPYLLIGFGRWGSSDPWLGIPVKWGQISGARSIIEATLPGMNVELSQGSHFFHNISSFRVSYFCVHHADGGGLNWDWIKKQKCTATGEFVRHAELEYPLVVKVDGRSGRGVILAGHK